MFENEATQKILVIALGSALGGNARYWLGTWIQDRIGSQFPLGTFIVNISGAFVLGLLAAFLAQRVEFTNAPALRLFFVVGFLGAYTTFSTLEYDTLVLADSGAYLLAAANACGSLIVGFAAVWIGAILGRLI